MTYSICNVKRERNMSSLIRFFLLVTFTVFSTQGFSEENLTNTTATIVTNKGDIAIELFDQEAPITVKNFIDYAKEGFYNNTIFHRVIPNFMIQGGGFTEQLARKPTKKPINNEAKANIANLRGTLAMARTQNPHSATSQFFINVVDNHYLNKNSQSAGYAVFGKVLQGMDIVDGISTVKTGNKSGMQNVPVEPVIIKEISIN